MVQQTINRGPWCNQKIYRKSIPVGHRGVKSQSDTNYPRHLLSPPTIFEIINFTFNLLWKIPSIVLINYYLIKKIL